MDWQRIAGNWPQFALDARQYWPRLSVAQLETIAGRREALCACIQSAYGVSLENADGQICGWERQRRDTALTAAQPPTEPWREAKGKLIGALALADGVPGR